MVWLPFTSRYPKYPAVSFRAEVPFLIGALVYFGIIAKVHNDHVKRTFLLSWYRKGARHATGFEPKQGRITGRHSSSPLKICEINPKETFITTPMNNNLASSHVMLISPSLSHALIAVGHRSRPSTALKMV